MSQEQASGGKPKYVLNALVRDVKTFALILRAVAFAPICQVNVASYGLKVVTEVNGVLEACAYLSSGLFNEYTFHPEEEDLDVSEDDEEIEAVSTFDMSLSDLLVCLNIYGNAGISVPGKAKERDEDITSRKERERRAALNGGSLDTEMRIIYERRGEQLILELQEGSTCTRCKLSTYNSDILRDMTFRSDQIVGQVIMASKDLTEALQSIDSTSKEVTFSFSNERKNTHRLKQHLAFNTSILANQSRAASSIIMSTADSGDEGDDSGGEDHEMEMVQMMKLKSEGDNGSTELEMPNQNKLFEQFTCHRNYSQTYHFAALQRCLKALQTSLKTSLRIDDEGMMDLQCLFPKRVEQALNPHADLASSNNRQTQIDPENQGFVELKIYPVFHDEDQGGE